MEMFKSFSSWRTYTEVAIRTFCVGVGCLIVSVVIGIASVFRALWLRSVKFVGNYPNIALGGFLVAITLVWVVTFVRMRARAVIAEDQRDSITWQFSRYKEQHEIIHKDN